MDLSGGKIHGVIDPESQKVEDHAGLEDVDPLVFIGKLADQRPMSEELADFRQVFVDPVGSAREFGRGDEVLLGPGDEEHV